MRFDILSLFPDYFTGPLREGMVGRAVRAGTVEVAHVDIRLFSKGNYHRVDDRPYGGGPGMVLQPGPVAEAIASVRRPESRVVYLAPQGELLNARRARALAAYPHLVLLCGHYEGVDQRVIDHHVDDLLSIGDYILTSGCPAALVVIEAVARFVPGVLGDEESAASDSFERGGFEAPHYTRPRLFEGEEVPEVLLSGDHARIAEWRAREGRAWTARSRPELLEGGGTRDHSSEE